MVTWSNEIPAILNLFWAKGETTGKTNQYYRKTLFQLKLVKWSKKNANSRSHLRKINDKNKTKARTLHIAIPEAVTREITALAVICAQNQW